MANRARRILAVAMGAMTLAAARPAAASEAARMIVVQTNDSCAVPSRVLEEAQHQAARIYAAIGVSILWVNGEAEAPEFSSNTLRLTVSLLSQVRTETLLDGTRLPTTVLGVAPRHTGRVYVFCGRISRRAMSKGEDFETILGRVLAHEIGHHLLPAQGHSDSGIMRASLNYSSVEPPAFDTVQAESIRTLLMAAR